MALDLYNTHAMLEAVKLMPPKHTFLRDRYFKDTATFPTKDVVVDYKDEQNNRLAPFVLPSKGGIPVEREGYQTETFEPALIAPERVLTADDLMTRRAGEALFSGATAQSREAEYLREDIEALNALIDNREEYMCAQVLLANAYTMKQYGDKYGSSEHVDRQIKFYEGGSNPATYVTSPAWSTSSTKILSDIYAMAQINIKRGLPMTDLIVAGNVADVMLQNEMVLNLLDNRRFILSDEVRPEELGNGAAKIATLNIKGHIINVFCYTAEYVDESGNTQAFIPANTVVMTAPGMGKILYGSVTQIQPGTRNYETFEGKRIPKVTVDEHGGSRALTMQSRPLVMPKYKNAAIVSTVLS